MHASLQQLLLAFPLSVEAGRGRVVVRRRGYERVLLAGQQAIIEPFEAFALRLDGSSAQPAACTLEMRGLSPAQPSECLHHRLAKRVFLQPQYAWNAAFIAERLGMSAAQLRRALFAQGTALTDLCRTQRLMRLLFDVMADDAAPGEARRRVGWPANSDVDSAFYDRFGVSLEAARRLSRGRELPRQRSVA
ncbi:AraC family transcriptional regulator [Cupriavidus taiwanensis]|uniref:AraC family transcriptional regulator n=1 Tax=Cupriavidus taiwanensis TaxID=164546 RepID=UPI000E14762F|nr:AraC family transcriptional regulator [Cupriavidus taiwanensis]SPA51665.1 putative transcriptional regulator, HTH AraC [Cupriavidus taiwanensis]